MDLEGLLICLQDEILAFEEVVLRFEVELLLNRRYRRDTMGDLGHSIRAFKPGSRKTRNTSLLN